MKILQAGKNTKRQEKVKAEDVQATEVLGIHMQKQLFPPLCKKTVVPALPIQMEGCNGVLRNQVTSAPNTPKVGACLCCSAGPGVFAHPWAGVIYGLIVVLEEGRILGCRCRLCSAASLLCHNPDSAADDGKCGGGTSNPQVSSLRTCQVLEEGTECEPSNTRVSAAPPLPLQELYS